MATEKGVTKNMTHLNLKTPNVEQWEINGVGLFLLGLQDTNVIYYVKGELVIGKSEMRKEFHKFLSTNGNVTLKAKFEEKLGVPLNIGKLLFRTNFLINTPRSCNYFRIKDFSLNKFRLEKFYQYDEIQRNGGRLNEDDDNTSTNNSNNDGTDKENPNKDPTIDTSKAIWNLQYEGSQTANRDPEFELTNMGCKICQLNFDEIQEFEEHVEYHGEPSDFKSLESMEKLSSPMLKLSYQLCVKSHMFAFTLESTVLDKLIIEKIIIVKSRCFHYVNVMEMPITMESKGKYIFFADSHLFKISVEQPIVILFKPENSHKNDTRAPTKYHVEQHHFMRTEPFPLVYFAINPYRLSSLILFRQTSGLQNYLPTYDFIKALSSNWEINLLLKHSQGFRKYFEQQKCLTLQNMPGALTTMLQVEDIETLMLYRKLTQKKVHLRQFGREISLRLCTSKMTGNENFPSPGDDVILIAELENDLECKMLLANSELDLEMILKNNKQILKTFRWSKLLINFGHVDQIINQRAYIKCNRRLLDKCTYTVIFRPGRFTFRHQYRALNQLETINSDVLKCFLYPEIDRSMQPMADLYNLQLLDHKIYGNPEQLNAVKQIARRNSLQTPFIVYGPPGTGKTATIVEAIMQLLIQRSDTRILVMSGSNSACNEISLRLLRQIAKTPFNDGKTLVRIFSRANDKRVDNIDETLLEYSNMYSTHFYPHVSALHEYRIVACTLSIAGKLSMGGFGKNEYCQPAFTHIFIDEAAASTEAETIMGLTCAMSLRATLILSGDPKQLGAVLQSMRARNLGLGESLMERLLKRECYQLDESGEYNRNVQSRLLRNYRSHPMIVKMYSDLFYDGQLIALAQKDDVNLCEKWYKMPNTNFPIIFHAEFGTAYKSPNSVSLCNYREIDAVMNYVKELMYFGINGKRLKESDIGIISPYKSQYSRIQEQLNMRNWHKIECGSVETFQGKEKQVIIVSFVRSFSETLGFLDNPRRLNVTLSRAKSLLILIGNPRTLSINNDFKAIIDTCKREDSILGAPVYETASDNSFAAAFNAMEISRRKTKSKRKPKMSSKKKTTTALTTKKLNPNQDKTSINEDDMEKFFESLPRVPTMSNRVTNINEEVNTSVAVPPNNESSNASPPLVPMPAKFNSKKCFNEIKDIVNIVDSVNNSMHKKVGPTSNKEASKENIIESLEKIGEQQTYENGMKINTDDITEDIPIKLLGDVNKQNEIINNAVNKIVTQTPVPRCIKISKVIETLLPEEMSPLHAPNHINETTTTAKVPVTSSSSKVDCTKPLQTSKTMNNASNSYRLYSDLFGKETSPAILTSTCHPNVCKSELLSYSDVVSRNKTSEAKLTSSASNVNSQKITLINSVTTKRKDEELGTILTSSSSVNINNKKLNETATAAVVPNKKSPAKAANNKPSPSTPSPLEEGVEVISLSYAELIAGNMDLTRESSSLKSKINETQTQKRKLTKKCIMQ